MSLFVVGFIVNITLNGGASNEGCETRNSLNSAPMGLYFLGFENMFVFAGVIFQVDEINLIPIGPFFRKTFWLVYTLLACPWNLATIGSTWIILPLSRL